MDTIKNKIKDFFDKYSLNDSEKTYIIGFSGGYDSLCLLDILHKEYHFSIVAAHLNHNWRGEESLQEELRAKKYCQEKGITFYSETLSSYLPKTELEARNQRYEFFKKAKDKFNADAVFTGHTKTDNIETVLYRIIKGTGLKGLCGIPEKRMLEDIPVYRPMLDILREDTIQYCVKNNLSPNVDSSNENIHYQRNKIRHNLIPSLKEYNSGVEDSILRLCEISKNSEDIIAECLNNLKKELFVEDSIVTSCFKTLSESLKRRIIKDFLENNNIEIDYKKVCEIVDFIKDNNSSKSGNTVSLTTSRWLFVSSDILKIINHIKADVIKSSVEVKINVSGGGETFFHELGIKLVCSRWIDAKPDTFPKETDLFAFVDLNCITRPLCLRTRQDGDKIKPFGMNETMRLKKYLINKGIPEFQRDAIPLLAIEKEILWAAGIGISEKIRVENIPTHKIEIIKL